MASGLLNDVTAWVLLALVVALLNAGNGLEVVWVLLTTLGFALFLIFLVRPLYRRLCIATGSIQNGPSPLLMTVTLVMVLASAFVTDIIGVHAIFGGFLAGVIIPHDGDLATKIAEKIEDIVNIIFLPLYFTLSGLQTQIGLLNTGQVWGYVILVIVLACFGKIVGCTVAAKLGGMTVRESFAVGFLMNCKGLVELIVLNIGHNAGVLNDQVFVIMVVMALVTTFMTTPFVMWLYPEWYQKQQAERRREAAQGADGSPSCKVSTLGAVSSVIPSRYRLVTMLNDLESVPSMMSVIRRYRQEGQEQLELHTLRLRELTDRATDIMKIRDERETLRFDPVLNVIRTFASLIGVDTLYTRLEFLGRHEFLKVMGDYSESCDADIMLLPCPSNLVNNHTLYDNNIDDQLHDPDQDFVKEVLSIDRTSSVGLLIDRGLAASLPTLPSKQLTKDTTQHPDDPFGNMNIIVPIAGGADDRAALLFALRLKSSHTHILHVTNTTTSFQHYATMQSIKNTLATATPYVDDGTLLSTLFVTGEPDASALIEYTTIQDEQLTTTTFASHYATQSLTRQDLVIVGHESAQALGFPTQRFAFLTPSVLVVRAAVKAGSSTATEQ